MSALLIICVRVLDIYTFIIFISCIVSFLPMELQYSKPIMFIRAITNPVFDFVRKLVPLNFGMFDLSPIVVLFLIYLLKRIIIGLYIGF